VKQAKNVGADQASTKRQWFRIGPGLVIAVVLAVILGGNAIKNDFAQRSSNSRPIIENRIVGGSRDSAGPTPNIKFLIDHRDKLGLTQHQIAAITNLNQEWESTYGPKLKAAKAQAGKLKDFLAKSASNKRTPVAGIQQEAAPYVALSSEISAARREYWARAMSLLTPKQRQAVIAERKAGLGDRARHGEH
jgi:Spy/CpxP family protein refolding chaperone